MGLKNAVWDFKYIHGHILTTFVEDGADLCYWWEVKSWLSCFFKTLVFSFHPLFVAHLPEIQVLIGCFWSKNLGSNFSLCSQHKHLRLTFYQRTTYFLNTFVHLLFWWFNPVSLFWFKLWKCSKCLLKSDLTASLSCVSISSAERLGNSVKALTDS